MKKKATNVIGIAGLLAAATSVYLFIRNKTKKAGATPPQGAPQLKVNNPGDQSEFLAAPADDRDLG